MKSCFLALALTVLICTSQERRRRKQTIKDYLYRLQIGKSTSSVYKLTTEKQTKLTTEKNGRLGILTTESSQNITRTNIPTPLQNMSQGFDPTEAGTDQLQVRNTDIFHLKQKYLNVSQNLIKNITRYPKVTKISTTSNIHTIHQRTLDVSTTENLSNTETERPILPQCKPQGLGPFTNEKNLEHNSSVLIQKYSQVRKGGQYSPPNCSPAWRVAIIVPYRNRPGHLKIFSDYIHPFLMKQELEYGIYIIEQAGSYEFNRAKLLNVGYVISQKLSNGKYQCFIFHDIDMLPLDTRNLYSCPEQPRHHCAIIDRQFRNNKRIGPVPRYRKQFGGVSAVTEEQFKKVNGFSNSYWGWGGEDDDMSNRRSKMIPAWLNKYSQSIKIINSRHTWGYYLQVTAELALPDYIL